VEAWGVDGCREGWFFFRLDGDEAQCGVVSAISELAARSSEGAPILIDIPIGLHDSSDVERTCDLEARRALSPIRASSVFPAPCRSAVYAPTYDVAVKRNRERMGKGLSKQSWAISPKIREVDSLLQAEPRLRERIREVHPEVCFWGLTGRPMPHSKKTREGFRDRLEVLSGVYPDAPGAVARAFLDYGGFEALRDDIIDALVAAVCASHISECRTLPSQPGVDPTGLRMEMVYWQTTLLR